MMLRLAKNKGYSVAYEFIMALLALEAVTISFIESLYLGKFLNISFSFIVGKNKPHSHLLFISIILYC